MPLKWSIYATNDPYSWCENHLNSTSILLATESTVKHHILAGVCFNFDQLSLQTVNYNVSYSKSRDLELLMGVVKSNLGNHKTLTDDLWILKTSKISDLSKEVLQEQLTELGEKNSWLNLANYEVDSIVQGASYVNYFKEYKNILNIIWWHSLRLGNWKRFMNTLYSYAYNNSFELFTGTSDVVKFPTETKCEQNDLLEIKLDFKNKPIPAYIWTYLKSSDNLNRDFIIVGYNSPYAEFFTLENVIFCPDICSEIPWLNEIRSSFRFSFAGIMFCCSTDFIMQTNRLNGFPMDVLLPRNSENNAEDEATTTIDMESDTSLDTDYESESTSDISPTTTTEEEDYYYSRFRFYNRYGG